MSTELPVSINTHRTSAVAILSCTTNGSLCGTCNGRISSGSKIMVGPLSGRNSFVAITWLSCRICVFLYLALNSLASSPSVMVAMTSDLDRSPAVSSARPPVGLGRFPFHVEGIGQVDHGQPFHAGLSLTLGIRTSYDRNLHGIHSICSCSED